MAICTSGSDDGSLYGLSLCAGVGGLDLGLHIAEPGYRAVGYVERNSFAAACLVARMEDACLAPAPIWDDLKSFDGRPWRRRVHIVTAGYPCQPFTFSGHRQGREDPRHLWPDVARIVKEVGPQWCFFENVPGHLSLGFHDVIGDLQGLGYRAAACVVSAAETGAPHIRDRLFILAHADSRQLRQPGGRSFKSKSAALGQGRKPVRQPNRPQNNGDGCFNDARPSVGRRLDAKALCLYPPGPFDYIQRRPARDGGDGPEPLLYRHDDGMAFWMDRSAAAGNGVVPLAAARAWRWLKAELLSNYP